ncbi:MAG: alpha/beta hydrolase fold domain-containing protein, partial [Anaerolineales bacterium]|nr:alpha/beta hydrolase fold domain-containing protein [Anaerolineales bacterium]
PILTRRDMDWFVGHYLSGAADSADPRFSPLLGHLAGLPPALILTAEYDPLRDQGRAYAAALQGVGGTAVYREYPRQPHGFLSFAGVSGQANAAFADVARFLQT